MWTYGPRRAFQMTKKSGLGAVKNDVPGRLQLEDSLATRVVTETHILPVCALLSQPPKKNTLSHVSNTNPKREKKEENKKKTLPVENNLEEVESDIEVKEVQGGSCGTMEKFKSDLNQLKGENRLLKEEIRLLKEENRLLKQERDLLKEKSRSSEAGSKGSQKRSHDLGESSDSSEPESSFETKKAAKKRRRKPASSSSSSDEDSPKKKPKKASFGKRVSSPEDVVHHYKKLVRMYKRTRSIPETCRAFDLDRNTIAGTAVIADVLIAGEGGDFGELPIIAEKQSLASFAKACKAFLDANPTLKEKVDKMRKANELLTIKYKFQK
ncbi:hypothetical protein ABVT39_010324 [Epinephelus coioides]